MSCKYTRTLLISRISAVLTKASRIVTSPNLLVGMVEVVAGSLQLKTSTQITFAFRNNFTAHCGEFMDDITCNSKTDFLLFGYCSVIITVMGALMIKCLNVLLT